MICLSNKDVFKQAAQHVQGTKVMSIQDIYGSGDSAFLKAADLQGNSPVVVIESAVVEKPDFGDGEKPQIVLTFRGAQKKLGLNKTNAMELARLFGTEDFTRWVGQQIRLYVTKVKFQNQMVDAIRIWPELPMYAQQPAAAPAPVQQAAPAMPAPPAPQPVAPAPAPITAQTVANSTDAPPF